MLQIQGLAAAYGKIPVLWDISLQCDPGEIVALVGPNGAGKTTLLRVVSGMLKPRAGQVVLNGQDLTGMSPRDRVALGLAHVPEGRHVFSSLTVEENLLAANADAAACEAAFELFPILGERRQQTAGTLSGGQQQMLSIARGLATNPRLLLVDELSLGLSPRMVQMAAEALRALAQRGLSIVLVEQYVPVALALARRVTALRKGRVWWTGDAGEAKKVLISAGVAGGSS